MTKAAILVDGREALTTTELCRQLGVGAIPVSLLKKYGATPAFATTSGGTACYWWKSDVSAIARMVAEHLLEIAEGDGRVSRWA